MCALSAVGVHDNLAAGEARVAVGAANYELAGGVHIVLDVIIEQACDALVVDYFEGARDEDVDHILADALLHGLVRVKLVVLRADDNGVDAHRAVVVVVFDGHLALRIGAQIGHHPALAADVGQHL